jgi:hypothetical protein
MVPLFKLISQKYSKRKEEGLTPQGLVGFPHTTIRQGERRKRSREKHSLFFSR